MPPVSREQVRARRAYMRNRPLPERAESLPGMIQTNGLLATWAFLLSKGPNTDESRLLDILAEHLWRSENPVDVPPSPRNAFLTWIGDAPGQLTGSHLRQLTDEALAFSAWLKRAAQAGGGGD